MVNAQKRFKRRVKAKKPKNGKNVTTKNLMPLVKQIIVKSAERKVYEYPVSVTLNNLSPGWDTYNILQILQGTDKDQRIGDSITITRLVLRLNINSRTTDALDPLTVRMFIIDKLGTLSGGDMTAAIVRSYSRFDSNEDQGKVLYEFSQIDGNADVSRLNGLHFINDVVHNSKKSHFFPGTTQIIKGFWPHLAIAGYQTFASVDGPIMTLNHSIRLQGNIYIEYFDA